MATAESIHKAMCTETQIDQCIPLLVSSFHLLKNREDLDPDIQQNIVFQVTRFSCRFTLEFPEMSLAPQVLSVWRPYKDMNMMVLIQSTSRKESNMFFVEAGVTSQKSCCMIFTMSTDSAVLLFT